MAYGARLESVLGASPRGFESPILRVPRKRTFANETAKLSPWSDLGAFVYSDRQRHKYTRWTFAIIREWA